MAREADAVPGPRSSRRAERPWKCRFAGLLALALAISAMVIASPAQAMFMEAAGDQLILSGGVGEGDYERLKRLLDEHGDKITTVVLRNSPGGRITAMTKMMDLVHQRRLRTVVAGYCRSACANIFLAGKERHFASESLAGDAYLAFHGIYDDRSLLHSTKLHELRMQVHYYTAGMIDPALVDRWLRVASRRGFIYFLDSARLQPGYGASVLQCEGLFEDAFGRPNKALSECEKIPGIDVYEQGIVTSRDLISINGIMETVGDQVIISTGLGANDDARLRQLLDENAGKIATVVLRGIVGGDSAAGDRMAALIRERGLRTAVSGYCRAACARAFLGGVERQLTDESPAEMSYVALQGDYDDAGMLRAERHEAVKRAMMQYTGGEPRPRCSICCAICPALKAFCSS
jgi:hypothetical protein